MIFIGIFDRILSVFGSLFSVLPISVEAEMVILDIVYVKCDNNWIK